MKKCPFCAESIQDEAIKCRYCQSFLNADGEADGADSSSDTANAAQGSKRVVPTARPALAGDDDGWHAAGNEASAAAASKSRAPMLLKPEVAGGLREKPSPRASIVSDHKNDEDEAPRPSRRVLYSGSPSWRAFFKHYAAAVAAALVGPFVALWIAGLLEAGTLAKVLAVVIPLGLAGLAFFAVNLYRRSKVFRVTTTNIESEYGVLSKKIDVLELWRCRDVRYQQSLFDRILRIAHIEVMTADVTTPQLCIEGLPASRQLFEKIRDSIEIQRQSRNVVGFVQ